MPVCRFGRAYRCRWLAGLAAFGRNEDAKQTYYGLRAHLRVCWPGVVTDGHLAPVNLHDLTMAEELLVSVRPQRVVPRLIRAKYKVVGCWRRGAQRVYFS